jgi:hypothetical protein
MYLRWPLARALEDRRERDCARPRSGRRVTAVLLKIYAHCIDRQADAANRRIADAPGTQTPSPRSNPVTEMTAARRHPEVPAQRQEAGRTVSVTAPTGPVRGFFRPRPWPKPDAHGRIADAGGPGRSLERRMCWSAA